MYQIIKLMIQTFQKKYFRKSLNYHARKQIHIIKNFHQYNKTVKYLDDRPIFDDERIFVETFAKRGLDLEREQRQKYKKEQQEQHMRLNQNFNDLICKYREEQQQQENFSNIEQPSHLSTYNTESNTSDVRSSAQQYDLPSEYQIEKHFDKQSDNQSENNSRIGDKYRQNRSVDGDSKSIDGANEYGSVQVEINTIVNFVQIISFDEID